MSALEKFLDQVKVGRGQEHANMTIFPLLSSETGEPNYLTLEESLDKEQVEVTEVDQGGSVPELRLINRAGVGVLILAGEELLGAKQNRTVNSTFMVAAQSEVILPVSCVERGRWNHVSDKFSSGHRMMNASLRSKKQSSVSQSLRRGEGYRSNQGEVWAEIDQMAANLHIPPSPTDAASELFQRMEEPLDAYLKAFMLVDCQVGGVFAINGHIVGMDCLGYQDTFKKFFDKLVRSYALDALGNTEKHSWAKLSTDRARGFLQSVSNSRKTRHPSLGLGEDVRLEGTRVAGAALELEDRLIHLAAFRTQEGQNQGRKVPFGRYSSRRNGIIH